MNESIDNVNKLNKQFKTCLKNENKNSNENNNNSKDKNTIFENFTKTRKEMENFLNNKENVLFLKKIKNEINFNRLIDNIKNEMNINKITIDCNKRIVHELHFKKPKAKQEQEQKQDCDLRDKQQKISPRLENSNDQLIANKSNYISSIIVSNNKNDLKLNDIEKDIVSSTNENFSVKRNDKFNTIDQISKNTV